MARQEGRPPRHFRAISLQKNSFSYKIFRLESKELRMKVSFDEGRARDRIREYLEKARNAADPGLLDRYLRLFRQEIAFFRRSFVAAYMLMEFDLHGDSPRRERNAAAGNRAASGEYVPGERRSSRRENSARAGESAKVRAFAEEESVRLFFSAGRSRRVFPREILGLILSRCSVSKDEIGTIRILDYYSFVQVRPAAAERIIGTLNGKPFRGQPLIVNYARTRKDAAGETGPGGEDGLDGSSLAGEAAPGGAVCTGTYRSRPPEPALSGEAAAGRYSDTGETDNDEDGEDGIDGDS
jgi:hypothetical protein